MGDETRMLQLEDRLYRSDRVLTQQAAGAMILLSLHSGQYYELNDVGSCVWELCDGTKRVDEVIGLVCDMYAASADAIQTDVMTLLQELVEEELLCSTKVS